MLLVMCVLNPARPPIRAPHSLSKITAYRGCLSGIKLNFTEIRGENVDLRKLKTLIELVESSGISELEVTEGEEKVKIVKAGYLPANSQNFGGNYQTLQQVGQNSVNAIAIPPAAPPAPPAPAEVPGHTVKSPMVGTFYRSASPGSKVFVDIGSEVKEGDVLCIVEAMKLLNEIPSDRAGIVRKILVENGQPVEYGQTLFLIE